MKYFLNMSNHRIFSVLIFVFIFFNTYSQVGKKIYETQNCTFCLYNGSQDKLIVTRIETFKDDIDLTINDYIDYNKKHYTVEAIAPNSVSGVFKSITIPATITNISPQFRSEHGKVKEFIVDERNPNYCSAQKSIYTKDKKTLVAVFCNCESIYEYEYLSHSGLYVYEAFPTNLEPFEIPEQTEEIGSYAFVNSVFNKIIFPANLKRVSNYGFSRLIAQDLYFKEGLTSLGDYAFQEAYIKHDKLTQLELPKSCKTLGVGCFQDARITTVALSPDTQVIPDYAFYNSRIYSVENIEELRTIGQFAFMDCRLKTFKIGKNLSNIHINSFGGIKSTSFLPIEGSYAYLNQPYYNIISVYRNPDFTVDSQNPNFISDEQYVVYKPENALIKFRNPTDNTILPDVFTCIWPYACGCMKLERYGGGMGCEYDGYDYIPTHSKIYDHITFPEGLEKIYEHGCQELPFKSMTLPNSLKEICDYGFYNSALRELYIPDGVESIGGKAFIGDTSFNLEVYDNNKLISLHLGNGVKTIGSNAFRRPHIYFDSWGNYVNNFVEIKELKVEATTPPTCESPCFGNFQDVELFVPEGCKTKYEQAPVWSNFEKITANLYNNTPLIGNQTPGETEYYNLQGHRVQNPSKGIFIQKDETGRMIKILK